MLGYFDLNKRALEGRRHFMRVDLRGVREEKASGDSSTLMNLELGAKKTPPEVRQEDLDGLPPFRQILMYVGIVIGVLFSSFVSQFREGASLEIKFTLSKIIISSIIALAIIPKVYEKLNLNPRVPFIVQLGIFVQNGVFWHTLIKAIADSI